MTKEEFIANVRYLGWICFQMGAGLPLHDVGSDYKISEERLRSLIDGTNFTLEHPETTPEENHKVWMDAKINQGYTYGSILNIENKTHPSLIPYEELSEVEKRKDDMDLLMVKLAEQLYNSINK